MTATTLKRRCFDSTKFDQVWECLVRFDDPKKLILITSEKYDFSLSYASRTWKVSSDIIRIRLEEIRKKSLFVLEYEFKYVRILPQHSNSKIFEHI